METSILVGILIGIVNAWFWYDKLKSDKMLENHVKQTTIDKERVDALFISLNKELSQVAQKQTEHDNKFVTDQRVRDIVKDEIKPLKEDLSHLKLKIDIIMTSLVDLTTELKIHNALRESKKENN